jgi:hypothetical protein
MSTSEKSCMAHVKKVLQCCISLIVVATVGFKRGNIKSTCFIKVKLHIYLYQFSHELTLLQKVKELYNITLNHTRNQKAVIYNNYKNKEKLSMLCCVKANMGKMLHLHVKSYNM